MRSGAKKVPRTRSPRGLPMADPSGSDSQQEPVSAEGDSAPNGRITFRTVWGGPSPQTGLIEELAWITRGLRAVRFSYHFDLFLTVGGEISPVSGPSGLRAPRVYLARRTVTGEVRVSKDEVSAAPEPRAFMRQTIHAAVADLLSRVAARDAAFDADTERTKIAFLVEEPEAPDTAAIARAASPDAGPKRQ